MRSFIHKRIAPILLAVVTLVLSTSQAGAQTTEFTYQGKLSESGKPASGTYDFEFLLYDSLSGGTAQGLPVQRLNVAVVSASLRCSLISAINSTAPIAISTSACALREPRCSLRSHRASR